MRKMSRRRNCKPSAPLVSGFPLVFVDPSLARFATHLSSFDWRAILDPFRQFLNLDDICRGPSSDRTEIDGGGSAVGLFANQRRGEAQQEEC